MLPQLRELEMAYAEELAVVGVQSGKFIAERVTSRIRDASLRLGATHPIVNDRQYRIWRDFAVNAWPTIVAIDPRGYVLGQHAGEFTAETLAPFLESMITASREKGELERQSLTFPVDRSVMPAGQLSYPGGVVVSGRRIAIADTGHNRVLVGTLDAGGLGVDVLRVVGTGTSGFDDGASGSFEAPQGMTFGDGVLYVADSGNHAVRAIDLETGQLRTVAGTGHQLRSAEDVAEGALSSPWDVTLVGGTLYIAMAGTHQIFALDTRQRMLRVHAGNRRESIHDGPLREASLAQPMGIVTDGERLLFADAESSAIRTAGIHEEGEVHTLVGTGLFDFGDKDGVGDDVRLQHPQGLCIHADGRILIADSYNDSLKWLNPASRTVTTWVRGLHEPSGVSCGESFAYVADTNAHAIRAVDYATGTIHDVSVRLPAL